MLDPATPLQFLKGVGPRLSALLAEKSLVTVDDLVHYLPTRYEDRLNPRGIAELRAGEMATVIAEVRSSGLFRTRRMPLFELVAGQGRARLKCIWFNAAYLKDKFKPGQWLALYGKVESNRQGELQLIQPEFEVLSSDQEENAPGAPAESLETGRIVPVYETAANGKITARWFRKTIHSALARLPGDTVDPIPADVRRRLRLMSAREALNKVHWPDPGEPLERLHSARSPAHIRLIFEELFFVELGLELKRRRQKTQTGIAFDLNNQVRTAIKTVLPFHPTSAQKRALKEIADDMKKPSPMRRLLQGDVGSGKTIVAFQAAIIAMENGYQVALMAPTEILAQQHYFSARRILERSNYRIVLLTGSMDDEHKRAVRRHIAEGNAQMVIGTHALLQKSVDFHRLGLVIVDEQHRFGVMQRLTLMKKSAEPDVLVMTATPIPRTLALTLYGDLDCSVIDGLPPGRTPIATSQVASDQASRVWEFVRSQVQLGHQAYVVYPVIEESDQLELKAALSMYKQLSADTLRDLRVGLLHGRMTSDMKDQVMRLFQSGGLDVLVATTVIEVGVDVPNATVMVIEHAERFGLSQLHQLRGRIGRGAAKSYCILMTGGKISENGERRLAALVGTNNGFELAELDLELRGPGEFFGTRQAGLPSFQVANIVRDRDLLEVARREAATVLGAPENVIPRAEVELALRYMRQRWQKSYGLVEAG